MSNLYARPLHLRQALGIEDRSRDDEIRLTLERVSRAIDAVVSPRHFYAYTQTRYFDGNWSRRLLLHGDLISVTTLKVDDDGDGTYEITLAATTDYWLTPDNPLANRPYTAIDLNPNSTLISAWPLGRRRVQLVGIWGYSAEVETTGYLLNGAINSTTATTITVDDGHDLEAGEMLVIGTEQMMVVSLSNVSRNTVTVTRGQNGTTAATAADDAPISRRRFPRDIEDATIKWASRFLWQGQQGYMGTTDSAPMPGGMMMFPAIRDLLAPYRQLVVA